MEPRTLSLEALESRCLLSAVADWAAKYPDEAIVAKKPGGMSCPGSGTLDRNVDNAGGRDRFIITLAEDQQGRRADYWCADYSGHQFLTLVYADINDAADKVAGRCRVNGGYNTVHWIYLPDKNGGVATLLATRHAVQGSSSGGLRQWDDPVTGRPIYGKGYFHTNIWEYDFATDTVIYKQVRGDFNSENLILKTPPREPPVASRVNWDSLPLPRTTPTVRTLPYSETFDTFPDYIGYSVGAEGRIAIVNGRLRMDDIRPANQYSTVEAHIPLDLAGEQHAYILGTHRSINDETHPEDGVFAVLAGGKEVKLGLPNDGLFTYDVPAGTTEIVLRQYDNYPTDYDGREWDDLQVAVQSPVTPQRGEFTEVYRQSFDTLPTRDQGWEYSGSVRLVSGTLQLANFVRGSYQTNSAMLYLAFEPRTLVVKTNNLNDEKHVQDAIFAYTDHWIRVGDWDDTIIHLPIGVSRIRFDQYDNWTAPSDGRQIDELFAL